MPDYMFLLESRLSPEQRAAMLRDQLQELRLAVKPDEPAKSPAAPGEPARGTADPTSAPTARAWPSSGTRCTSVRSGACASTLRAARPGW